MPVAEDEQAAVHISQKRNLAKTLAFLIFATAIKRSNL